MRHQVAGRSAIGGREYQEDCWLVAPDPDQRYRESDERLQVEFDEGFLAVLADGIGGGGNGDVASNLVSEGFARARLGFSGDGPKQPAEALETANRLLGLLKSKDDSYGEMMGSTLLAAEFQGDRMRFLSVGDSPFYRFRDDEVHLINELHIRAHELDAGVSLGLGDWERISRDRQRGAITSAVTGQAVDEYQIAERRVLPGDVHVLASDGIEILAPDLMRRLVDLHRERSGAAGIADALISTACMHGEKFRDNRHDNTTVIVVVSEASDE